MSCHNMAGMIYQTRSGKTPSPICGYNSIALEEEITGYMKWIIITAAIMVALGIFTIFTVGVAVTIAGNYQTD